MSHEISCSESCWNLENRHDRCNLGKKTSRTICTNQNIQHLDSLQCHQTRMAAKMQLCSKWCSKQRRWTRQLLWLSSSSRSLCGGFWSVLYSTPWLCRIFAAGNRKSKSKQVFTKFCYTLSTPSWLFTGKSIFRLVKRVLVNLEWTPLSRESCETKHGLHFYDDIIFFHKIIF